MADETKSITSRGLGFFNANGVLKSKEELKADTAKNTSTEKTGESVSTDFSDRITGALGEVEARFVARANKAIEVTQSAERGIKEARDVATREIAVAKDLKKAVKNGNEDKAEKLRGKLSELKEEREALASRIDLENRESTGDRRQTLSVGNAERKSVVVDPVRFEARKEERISDLNTEDNIDAFIQARQAEKKDLRAQAKELRGNKKEIQEAVQNAREEISGIRKNSIKTYEKAEELTSKVAADIRAGGINLVEASISKSLSSEAVQKLIEAA